jgi:hypothetical protein
VRSSSATSLGGGGGGKNNKNNTHTHTPCSLFWVVTCSKIWYLQLLNFRCFYRTLWTLLCSMFRCQTTCLVAFRGLWMKPILNASIWTWVNDNLSSLLPYATIMVKTTYMLLLAVFFQTPYEISFARITTDLNEWNHSLHFPFCALDVIFTTD